MHIINTRLPCSPSNDECFMYTQWKTSKLSLMWREINITVEAFSTQMSPSQFAFVNSVGIAVGIPD